VVRNAGMYKVVVKIPPPPSEHKRMWALEWICENVLLKKALLSKGINTAL
jgi:hypothetical protein